MENQSYKDFKSQTIHDMLMMSTAKLEKYWFAANITNMTFLAHLY